PPFTKKDLEKAGIVEMLRVIREQEPSKPSTKLSTSDGLPTLAANRGTEPAKLTKLVRGELDWIVMRALEKDRNRRYETANGFAMDVQRYLADEPVQACPPSAGYRLRKFARRNRGALFAASALTLVVLLAVIGLAVGMVLVEQERSKAEQARSKAIEERDAAADARDREAKGHEATAAALAREAEAGGEAEKQRMSAVDQRNKAEELSESNRRQLYATSVNLALQVWDRGDLLRATALLESQRPGLGRADLRGFEWYYLWRLCRSE